LGKKKFRALVKDPEGKRRQSSRQGMSSGVLKQRKTFPEEKKNGPLGRKKFPARGSSRDWRRGGKKGLIVSHRENELGWKGRSVSRSVTTKT